MSVTHIIITCRFKWLYKIQSTHCISLICFEPVLDVPIASNAMKMCEQQQGAAGQLVHRQIHGLLRTQHSFLTLQFLFSNHDSPRRIE